MQRVIVIGPCGAGKSTLAIKLSAQLMLPLYHMDQLNWKPGWVESSKAEIAERLSAILSADRWLIEGNYSGTLAPRLAHADTVVYLDYPISLCVRRLLRRIWTYRGRTRPDMTDGCPERFDLSFLFYVMRWNAGPRIKTETLLVGHSDKLVRLQGPAALDRWIANLAAIPAPIVPTDIAPTGPGAPEAVAAIRRADRPA